MNAMYILLAVALACAILIVYWGLKPDPLKEFKLALLREALHSFHQSQYNFICLALEGAAVGRGPKHHQAFTELCEHIAHHVGMSYAQHWSERGYHGDFHAGRTLWIAQMLVAVENGKSLPPPPAPPEFPNE